MSSDDSSLSSSSNSEPSSAENSPQFSNEELEKFKTEVCCVVENDSKNLLKSLLLSNREGCKTGNWPLKNVAKSTIVNEKLIGILSMVKSRSKTSRVRKKSIMEILWQSSVSDNVLKNTIKRAQMLIALTQANQDQNRDQESNFLP